MGEREAAEEIPPPSPNESRAPDVVNEPMDEAPSSPDENGADPNIDVSDGVLENILSADSVTEEEAVREYMSLDKDLDSISHMLDVIDQRSDDLKGRILSLLNEMKTTTTTNQE